MELISNPTVIICAYTADRWKDILEAIESVRRQRQEAGEIVLVIDHNEELYARAKKAIADVVVIQNSQAKGLSGGRNSGIAAAKGDLIAFLDDDAIADPEWLSNMTPHFSDPRVLGVGGKSMPLWLGNRPRWFPEEFLWVVGCTYSGLSGGRVRNVLGGAMCIRRDVFVAAGGFAPWLGRTGSALPISCEETEFCMRANKVCAPGWFVYEPASKIRHKIKTERLTFRYFLKRCFAEGISKARLMSAAGETSDLTVERAYVVKTLAGGLAKGLGDSLFEFDFAGLLRMDAIVSGFMATATAYAYERLRGGVRKKAVEPDKFAAPRAPVRNPESTMTKTPSASAQPGASFST